MPPVVHERARGDAAQHWASIVVGVAVFFVVGWMTYEATNPRPVKKHDADAMASATASASASLGSSSGASSGAQIGDAGTASDLDAGLFMPTLSLLGDAAALLPTGGPRSVKLGVVLVTFQGAENAPPTARSKHDALVIAERLVGEARADFHHAVTSGDPGSSDDIGRMPRGVLDPRTEASVFALQTGDVSEVLETPKGYWIVKRVD
jgi:hypothetical protein